MAGGGEVIADGSIHWNIDHDNGSTGAYRRYTVQGVDPTPVADLRKGKKHPGEFQVKLRFNSVSEAQKALDEARKYLDKGMKSAGEMIEVVIFVPANKKVTREQASEPAPNRHAQIRVEW